ncbi:MAG: hypothetical protein JWR40_2381 [Massilia sp.]|jgi:hypothetical protein|nr:hypothetical protein [Massilia sp.]MDB5948218.1 hypothetical protein [Massilia sp.]
MMNKLCSIVAASMLLAMHSALAGEISDVGTKAYWGANAHAYQDVIGSSTYDISGATITRVGNVLTITIATNFAGHAGSEPRSAPGGIAYGDVFLAQAWNPAGSSALDPHHLTDNAANGTLWSYGFSLDNRWSNAGGGFTLYKLNGKTNAEDIKTTNSFMSCALGSQCYYRDGQAAAVDTASSAAKNTGLSGTWSVIADKSLSFKIDIGSSDLLQYSSFAMHWGETCGNDVIEGIVSNVPAPGTVPLLAMALGAMLLMRRRQSLPAKR